MGEINISRDEQNALAAIDRRELSRLVEQAILEERFDGLQHLRLTECGPYVATKYNSFRSDLEHYRRAKSAEKRTETEIAVRRAARELIFAIDGMKQRLEEEQNDRLLFIVDDEIQPPGHFGERMRLCVRYRWRRRVEDKWSFGQIEFVHDAKLSSDHAVTPRKRKPSAAKLEHERQSQLYHTWEYLMRSALCSVRTT